MNMICKWVRAVDGVLVMAWVKAGDAEVHLETDISEVAYAFEVFGRLADALTPVGVGTQ